MAAPWTFQYAEANGGRQSKKPAGAVATPPVGSPPATEPTTTPPVLPPRQFDACTVPGDDSAPTLVVIPPGRYWMGSPATEADRSSDESPRHLVTIPRPFAMSRCEITVGQFRRFVDEQHYQTTAEKPGSPGCWVWNTAKKSGGTVKGANWRNPGFAQTDEHPVVCVSFEDAQAYAAWLSRRSGALYRLPTEAEWEYAARAGAQTAYFWGEDKDHLQQCAYANGAGQETKAIAGAGWILAACPDPYVYTAPVASLGPNAFQLYDVSGNAWEWTADCWHGDYKNAPADGSAWQEADQGDCGRRVVRGGSWDFDPQNLRSALRGGDGTDAAYSILGFRLARAL